MAGIPWLPVEILTRIFTILTKADLRPLSSACKPFRAIVQPLLFSTIKIGHDRGLDHKYIRARLQYLGQVPHIASYIRHVTVTRNVERAHWLQSLPALLNSTTQLRSLHLRFIYVDGDLAEPLITRTCHPGFQLKFHQCIFTTTLTLTSTPIQLETLMLEACLGSPSFPLFLLENSHRTIRACVFGMAARAARPLIQKQYKAFEFPANPLVLPGLRSLVVRRIHSTFLSYNRSIENLWLLPTFSPSELQSPFENLPPSSLPNLRVYRGSWNDAKVFVPGRPIERILLDAYKPKIFHYIEGLEEWWRDVLGVITKSTARLLSFACNTNFTITAFKQIALLCPYLRVLHVQLAVVSVNRRLSSRGTLGVNVLFELLPNFKQLCNLNVDQVGGGSFETLAEFMCYLTIIKQKVPTITTVKWRRDDAGVVSIIDCGRWEGYSNFTPNGWSISVEYAHEDTDDWFPEEFWYFSDLM